MVASADVVERIGARREERVPSLDLGGERFHVGRKSRRDRDEVDGADAGERGRERFGAHDPERRRASGRHERVARSSESVTPPGGASTRRARASTSAGSVEMYGSQCATTSFVSTPRLAHDQRRIHRERVAHAGHAPLSVAALAPNDGDAWLRLEPRERGIPLSSAASAPPGQRRRR